MYGDLSNKLIIDAKRTSNLSELPLYQSDLVKDIVKEVNELYKDVQYLEEQSELDAMENVSEEDLKIRQCQLFVTHLCMRRNKRCLLAYQKLRALKLDEFAWLNIDPIEGEDLAVINVNSDNPIFTNYTTQLSINNLNHPEEEYYRQYKEVIVGYKANFPDLDLLGDLEPPRNIFIDVRVLRDGGEVQTEYGSFNLIKDSQFYVRKSDVERLIQQGYLEEL